MSTTTRMSLNASPSYLGVPIKATFNANYATLPKIYTRTCNTYTIGCNLSRNYTRTDHRFYYIPINDIAFQIINLHIVGC